MKRTLSEDQKKVVNDCPSLLPDTYMNIFYMMPRSNIEDQYTREFPYLYVMRFVCKAMYISANTCVLSKLMENGTGPSIRDYDRVFDFGAIYYIFITENHIDLVWWLLTIRPLIANTFCVNDRNKLWYSLGASGNIGLLNYFNAHGKVYADDTLNGAAYNDHSHVIDWTFASYKKDYEDCPWYTSPFMTDFCAMNVNFKIAAKRGSLKFLTRIVSAAIETKNNQFVNIITRIPGQLARSHAIYCFDILHEAIKHGQLLVLQFFESHGITLSAISHENFCLIRQEIEDGTIKDPTLVQYIKTQLQGGG